jgi:hypothetical protein
MIAVSQSVILTLLAVNFVAEVSFPMEPSLSVGVKLMFQKLLGGLVSSLAQLFISESDPTPA